MDTIGIVGTGLMGTGIAATFAAAAVPVVVHDTDDARLSAMALELRRIAAELRTAGLIDEAAEAALPDLITPTSRLADLSDRAFVLEAVPERVPVKQELYRALETVLASTAIIASTTSGLMPSVLARDMQLPGRFLVAHFWNPGYAIPLVEVVPGAATDSTVVTRTVALLRAIGQEPVVIRKEIAGFIGNRLQYALLREALAIVRSGAASAAEVDAVMRASLGRRLGYTGPIETADLGGLDTFLSIAEHLMPELAKDEEVLDLIRQHVAMGDIGGRSGQGFYSWPAERIAEVRGARDRDLLRRKLQDQAGRRSEAGSPGTSVV
jgi:3-hydroxybutyryl-CoA dehydrogenase